MLGEMMVPSELMVPVLSRMSRSFTKSIVFIGLRRNHVYCLECCVLTQQ